MTAQQIAAANANVVGSLVELNSYNQPEVERLAARALPNGRTTYKTLVRTSLPTVAFQALGGGGTHDEGALSLVEHNCYYIQKPVQVAKSLAAEFDKSSGVTGGFFDLQASGVMRAVLNLIGTSVWYGNNATNPLSPRGVKNFLTPASFPTASNYASGVFNVGGSTSSTASSVYAVHELESDQDVENFGLVLGQTGTGFDMDEVSTQMIDVTNPDGTTGRTSGLVTEMRAWVGVQIGHPQCVSRAANITAQAGYTLTDDVLAELYAQAPIGKKPTSFWCSSRSLRQLEKSRGAATGTSFTQPWKGQEVTPVMPTLWRNIPVYATDSILSTDAIES